MWKQFSISIQKFKFLIIWFINNNIFYTSSNNIFNLTSRYIPLGLQSGYDSVIKSQIPFYSFFHTTVRSTGWSCVIYNINSESSTQRGIYIKNPGTESDLSVDFLLNDTHKNGTCNRWTRVPYLSQTSWTTNQVISYTYGRYQTVQFKQILVKHTSFDVLFVPVF